MSRFSEAPLSIKMAAVALPLAIAGAIASFGTIAVYKHSNKPLTLAQISQLSPTAVLGETVCPPPATGTPPNCQPPPGYTIPTTCPAPYTGTPPNCQPPATTSPSTPPTTSTPPSTTAPPTSSPPTYTMPTTCPAPYTGTPPNCQPPPGGSYTPPGVQPNSPGAAPQAPPSFSINDPTSCIEKILGVDAANKFRSGSFNPTPDQIAKASTSGCFSAMVSTGSPSNVYGTTNFQTGQNPQAGALSFIPVAPPPQFQADSPAVSCAKQILGGGFGSQPSPDQMAQIQSKCFGQVGSQQQFGFNAPGGQGGPPPAALASANQNTPPVLPAELKSCVLKAGISEADINAIQNGQPPTAQQQQAGESCFSQYAKDKGYVPPTLTPPDPTQTFNPNSKQNQCADLVAQTHGIRFNQLNPGVVVSWSADDINKLRSCYGETPAGSALGKTIAFAPTSPQVTVSSAKLTCIQTALGADKLAAVLAGTASVSDADRQNVYNKCINPNKIAAGANPALLGVMAAMPPSDLEGQFIPINAQAMPSPSATGAAKASPEAAVTVGGEVNVPTGTTLPTKVDVFVKSTPQIFTVSLKKLSATKAIWTLNMAQNKLAVGNHKTYAVATLADASQMRSPDAAFAVAAKAVKNHRTLIVEAAIVAVVVAVGGWLGWRWHGRGSH